MIIGAVGFGPLGLPMVEFSGPAAVVWNSAYIVEAGGGGAPCGQPAIEKLPDALFKYLFDFNRSLFF
jgi:hypothetical protein